MGFWVLWTIRSRQHSCLVETCHCGPPLKLTGSELRDVALALLVHKTYAVPIYLSMYQVFAVTLSCGSHHNAIIDTEGELWTWGSNKYNCLGKTTKQKQRKAGRLIVSLD